MATRAVARPTRVTGGLRLGALVDRHFMWIGLAPAALCLLLVLVYPVLANTAYAFTNKSFLFQDTSFVGLKNYLDVLSDEVYGFWAALRVSLIWTFGTVAMQFLLGMGAALLLNQEVAGQRFFRVLLLVPWAFPVIVYAMIWRWMLNDQGGVITWLAVALGLMPEPVFLLGQPTTALPAVMGVAVWYGYPFMAASLLAGMQSINSEYYEVARIEGASTWQQFWHVTLAFLRPVIVVVLVLRTIWVFNAFELIYLLTRGGPNGATLTLPVLAYNLGWQQFLPGKAATVSVLMLLVLTLAAIAYFRALAAQREVEHG
ncbi:MAG TPA: sugar ABC transporter permease [Chloroflexota bacterium]|nr:sugar ABC transporter permease [Chloroflexota bacterium]